MENLKLDPKSRKVFIYDNVIPLRNKEFVLLAYFIRNVGKVLSRTQILEDVWDQNITCSTNTVDVHISSLRYKLRKHHHDRLIKTVHCIGYMFEI